MTWPGSPGAARGGAGYPWGESVALVVRAALLAGSSWHIGPHARDRLDDGNVIGPLSGGVIDSEGRLWVELACDVTQLEVVDSSTTGAGVMSRDEASTATFELLDPARIYDPANSGGPYWLNGHSRLTAGTPVEIIAEVLTPAGDAVDQFLLFAGLVDTWSSEVEQIPLERRAVVTASGAVKQAAGLDFGPDDTASGDDDTTAQRITRLLTRFGWEGALVQYGAASSARFAPSDFDGSLWELLSDTADAEAGFVRITPTGDVNLFTRNWLLDLPLPDPTLELGCADVSTGGTVHDVATDLELAAIDQQLRNAVYANRDGGDVMVARSEASIGAHGGRESVYRRSGLDLRSDGLVGEWAQFVVVTYAYPEPAPRTVELVPAIRGESDGSLWRKVLGMRVLRDILRVLWEPPNTAALDAVSWVMGTRHEITPQSWVVRYDLLPAARAGSRVWHIGPHDFDKLNDGNVMGWAA